MELTSLDLSYASGLTWVSLTWHITLTSRVSQAGQPLGLHSLHRSRGTGSLLHTKSTPVSLTPHRVSLHGMNCQGPVQLAILLAFLRAKRVQRRERAES